MTPLQVSAGETLPISTRSVVERDGSTQRTLLVFCPREDRAVSLDGCVGCAWCTRMNASNGQLGRPSVTCSFEPSRSPAVVAGSVLSRYSVCMRVDAVTNPLLTRPPTDPLLVVDEDMLLVGTLEPGPSSRVDDAVLRLAVEEHMPVHAVLAHMAGRRVRQVPVVAGDGSLVGVAEDLDAMRALRRR